jgi:hypothetical protein
VFFEKEGERHCAVHREGGPSLLPSACRNFPRVALRDPRGIFITLSHFCPTAAALLLNASSIAVVEAPASLSLDGAVEGLDATTVLPPLLAPGMLMDYEGYTTWEHQALAVLDDRLYTPSLAMRVITAATRDAVQWRPGLGSLAAHVTRSFEQSRTHHDSETSTAIGRTGLAAKAFLAAHLFASWSAYQDGGLSAVVRSVEHAWALIANENSDNAAFIAAVGAADLRIRHAAHSVGDHVSTRPLPALRLD